MALKSLSTRELRRELERRESGARKLQAQHSELAKRLAALEGELSDLGIDAAPARRGRKPGRPKGSGRGPGRPKGSKNKVKGKGGKRPKNDMTLPEAILKGVSVGTTVSPAQAAVAAKKAGYKSSSANFGMIVANALAKDSRFKKLGRGQYQRSK
ncbi:MAG TPA: hypothetical protein VK824_09980 [Planctomycetota bacterium]|nr:hypothetical protein [Planctomycetota bacterium]